MKLLRYVVGLILLGLVVGCDKTPPATQSSTSDTIKLGKTDRSVPKPPPLEPAR